MTSREIKGLCMNTVVLIFQINLFQQFGKMFGNLILSYLWDILSGESVDTRDRNRFSGQARCNVASFFLFSFN